MRLAEMSARRAAAALAPWRRLLRWCLLSFVQETLRSSRIILGDEQRTLKQVGFGGGRFSWVCRF
jgi:hypothetical protein